MNHDLIKQLQSLSPTEGEWRLIDRFYLIDETGIEIADTYHEDDAPLIQLAPTMRLAILEMAKEIEELKSQLESERNSQVHSLR